MKRVYIINYNKGKFSVPLFARFRKNTYFKFEYNGKFYETSIPNCKDNALIQLSLLVEGLNIKNKRDRINFVYDKTCMLLDNHFYGYNLCKFEKNVCLAYKMDGQSIDGCCSSKDGKRKCPYLLNHKCSINCISCKFFTCFPLRKKGIKYRVHDFLIIKYLYSWQQKIIILLSFFSPKEEIVKYLYKNSLIYWCIKFSIKNFVRID